MTTTTQINENVSLGFPSDFIGGSIMRFFYAFVNGKASCGQSNPTTGMMSTYGDIYKFKNKADRDDFCNQYDHQHNCYPEAVSKRTLRGYCLGMTVANFEDHLGWMDLTVRDEDGVWI